MGRPILWLIPFMMIVDLLAHPGEGIMLAETNIDIACRCIPRYPWPPPGHPAVLVVHPTDPTMGM
jgi:hypothetical protein